MIWKENIYTQKREVKKFKKILDEKTDKKDNVIEFPNKEDQGRKAA
jgi:hypothetical protein